MDYKNSVGRDQLHIVNLEMLIPDDDIVRIVDLFVDFLDLKELGFTYSEPKRLGSKSYDPKRMLKTHIFGYMEGVRSSRELEKAINRNTHYMWLMNLQKPSYKTISDFRKDNIESIKLVFMVFNRVCIEAKLMDFKLVSLDGTFIDAVNHNSNNTSKNKINRMLKKIENKFDKDNAPYLKKSKNNKKLSDNRLGFLREDMAPLEKKERLENLAEELDQKEETQMSLTDPDSRMMHKRGSKTDVCYNAQLVIDSKYNLIGYCGVYSNTNDARLLHEVLSGFKFEYGLNKFAVVADKGYGVGEEIKKCNDLGIETFVPMMTNEGYPNTPFSTSQFKYDEEKNCFICPDGKMLPFVSQDKKGARKYGHKKICEGCEHLKQCTAENKQMYRSISLNKYHDVIKSQIEKNKENPDILEQRKCMAEHPFGTIKRTMNQGFFLTKGLESVNGGFTSTSLAYNIKRVYNILGFDNMKAAIMAYFRRDPSTLLIFVQNLIIHSKTALNLFSWDYKIAC